MNCAEANQIDLVDYLSLLGNQPKIIRNHDHWYFSPFRDEKEPSFKVNKLKNVWYDHGQGIGGDLVKFAMEYYRCTVQEALEKIASFHGQTRHQTVPQNKTIKSENALPVSGENVSENPVKILEVKQPISDFMLSRYLKKRRIDNDVANKFCSEVLYGLNGKVYRAIGFRNYAGGYELRNEYFKGGSSPKYITFVDNNNNNSLSVFEGFFDFLSHQIICKNPQMETANYLILNSLSFFERSLLLMEKHASIKLYLDNDDAGKKYTSLALKRSTKYLDESKLYKGYKDLNDWVQNIGKAKQNKPFYRRRL